MRLSARPNMEVVQRDQKRSRLEAFFRGYVEIGMIAGTSTPLPAWRVIARSAESPVVLALATLAREVQAGRLDIMVLIAGGQPATGETSVLEAVASRHAVQVRRATDPRLIDAHEMLVLSPQTSWIGDSMRRDPAQRDSYECYAWQCESIARLSRISFERLWATAKPVGRAIPATVTLRENAATPTPPAGQPIAEPLADVITGPLASDRH